MVKNGERIRNQTCEGGQRSSDDSESCNSEWKVNEGRAVNKQIDMLPVLSGSVKRTRRVRSLVAEELGLKIRISMAWICSCITVWERSDGKWTVTIIGSSIG